jgi:hypothetical protein
MHLKASGWEFEGPVPMTLSEVADETGIGVFLSIILLNTKGELR